MSSYFYNILAYNSTAGLFHLDRMPLAVFHHWFDPLRPSSFLFTIRISLRVMLISFDGRLTISFPCGCMRRVIYVMLDKFLSISLFRRDHPPMIFPLISFHPPLTSVHSQDGSRFFLTSILDSFFSFSRLFLSPTIVLSPSTSSDQMLCASHAPRRMTARWCLAPPRHLWFTSLPAYVAFLSSAASLPNNQYTGLPYSLFFGPPPERLLYR